MAAVVSALGLPLPVSTQPTESELRQILKQLDGLPDVAKFSRFTQVSTRTLNEDLFEYLQSQPRIQDEDAEWTARLQLRSKNLRSYIGKILTCIFIRLPGVHYTVEIDATEGRVVHWEWQAC